MIQIAHLSKTFSKDGTIIHALDDVDVSIDAGEFTAVVGSSGSGKSTLLLAIAGLITPDRGEVLLDGENIHAMTTRQQAEFRSRKLGFVFQTFHLVPYLSAMENVQMAAYLAGDGTRQQREKAESVLSSVGLADRMHHKPSELSVGQRQRVAIARAIVNQPSTILADEPTGNLDPDTADEIIGLLQESSQHGMTVVMVTHSPRAAKQVDRSIRIENGKVI